MTNAEARFNKSLRPWKPEGSLGRTAQDVHLDSHTAPELCLNESQYSTLYTTSIKMLCILGYLIHNCRHSRLNESQYTTIYAGHFNQNAQYSKMNE